MEAVQGLRKARFERETWTYFALLYLHNGRGSYLDFEPLGVLCLVTSARSKGVANKLSNIQMIREFELRNVRRSKLRDAARDGNLEDVITLLDEGTQIDATDWYGWTPLMRASSGGHVTCVQLLVDRGAQINHQDKVSVI
eukprot:Em0006g771a